MSFRQFKRRLAGLLMLLVGTLTLAAQNSGDGYDPDNPKDPGDPEMMVSHTVKLASNYAGAGTLTGAGTYKYGATVTLKATTNTGYKFLYWTKGDSEESFSSSASFSYTMEKENVTFTAVYEKYTKVNVALGTSGAGTVTGGGYYSVGATATLKATASDEYSFLYWQKQGSEGVYSEDNPLNYTVERDDASFTAVYHYNYNPSSPADPSDPQTMLKHKVSVTVSDAAAGTVTGGGTYLYNKSVTISTSKKFGYKFLHWLKNDETEPYSTATSFSYTIGTEDVAFQAVYEFIGSYKVNLVAEPAGSSTFNKTSGVATENGTSYSVTAQPIKEHRFLGWYINDELVSSQLTYTFTGTTEDVTLVARSAYDPTAPVDPGAFLEVLLVCQPEQGGTTSPDGTTFMETGSNFSLSATPSDGYSFMGWYSNGSLLSATANYTHKVTADDTLIIARFRPTTPVPGDVNADNAATIADEAALINILNGADDLFDLSDIDEDGQTTTEDADMLRDIILQRDIEVKQLTMSPASATVNLGKTISLTATVHPACATNSMVSWKSSDETVATVDEYGIVTGVADGTATITATSANGQTATCTVTVISIVNYEDWTSTNAGKANSSSSHTYTIDYRAGQTLSFNWQVSSESGYDFLTITLDGSQIVRSSGVNSSTYSKTFTTDGTATLVATYSKDDSQNKNSDMGKIYNVKLQ